MGRDRQWMRTPTDFAQKFDIHDVAGLFKKQIVVEQGTKALMIQGGVYKGALMPGVYNLGSIIRTIGNIGLNDRTTVILIDSSEVPVTFTVPKGDLCSKDGLPVGVSGKLTVQISDPLDFLENYLKSRDNLTLSDISETIYNIILNSAQSALVQYNVEELFGNSGLRKELGKIFKDDLEEIFGSKGIEIITLDCIGFDDSALENVRKIHAEMAVNVAETEAGIERDRKLRNLITDEKIQKLRSQDDVQDLLCELQNKHLLQEFETANLSSLIEQKKWDTAYSQQVFRELREKGHSIDLKRIEDDYLRSRTYQDAETSAKIDALKTNAQMEKLSQLSKIQRERIDGLKQIDRQDALLRDEAKTREEGIRLENRTNASDEAVISMTSDPCISADLTKIVQTKRAGAGGKLSAEELLAINDPDAAAKAMSAKYSADEQREFNARESERVERMLDRFERMSEKALDNMGQTASSRGAAGPAETTVIPGFSPSSIPVGPVIITPPSRTSTESMVRCSNCGSLNTTTSVYCKECGRKLNL